MAFSWADPDHDKVPSLYVTSINGIGLHRLTHAGLLDSSPVWSPDGSQIAFVREQLDRSTTVMLISSTGGPERPIAETDSRFVSWSPTGDSLLITRKIPGQPNFELWAVAVASGARRMITAAGEYMDGWERFAYSPNGSLLAYAAWNQSKGPAELYVRDSSGGQPRQITWLGNRLHGWWCWMPDSRSLLIVAEEQGSRQLFRIRLDNPHAALEPVEGAGDDLLYPSAAAAAGKVRTVLTQQRITANIHRFEITRDPRGFPSTLQPGPPIAPATRMTGNPVISPDGKKLLFVSDRSLSSEIWMSDSDGSNARPLTSFSTAQNFFPGSPRWSPDGQKIVFAAEHKNVTDLYLMNVDGSSQAQLTHQKFDVIRPSFSHDGQFIWFSRRDNTAARLTIWKIPARAGATDQDAQPLTVSGQEIEGMEPVESPEGGTLYYVALNTRELWSVNLQGGKPRKVIESGIMHGWWTPAQGGIYYVDVSQVNLPGQPAHPAVLYFDCATHTTHEIARLPNYPNIQQPGLTVTANSLWTNWTEFSTTNLVRGELH